MKKQQVKEINVHGLTVNEAEEKIVDAIEDAYFDKMRTVRVVHGYNNGIKIKKMISESSAIRECGYVTQIREDLTNSGVTLIELKFHEHY